jgi:hypothetical protein
VSHEAAGLEDLWTDLVLAEPAFVGADEREDPE